MTPAQIKAVTEQLDQLAMCADVLSGALDAVRRLADDEESAELLALAAERTGAAWAHLKGAARAVRDLKP